jgi:hypothetical protein
MRYTQMDAVSAARTAKMKADAQSGEAQARTVLASHRKPSKKRAVVQSSKPVPNFHTGDNLQVCH